MISVFFLTVLAMLPQTGVACDWVDLIEVNHVYDDCGNLVLQQAIFYDWRPETAQYEVRAWRLVRSPLQRPFRDWRRGGWTMIFRDGERLREVRAAAFCESWTQYDVEIEERLRLPPELRRGLLDERRPGPRTW